MTGHGANGAKNTNSVNGTRSGTKSVSGVNGVKGLGEVNDEASGAGGPENRSTEDVDLAGLGARARELARELPAPLRRIRLGAGDLHLEIEWQEPAPGTAAPAAGGAPAPEAPAAETDPGGPPSVHVTSPMVGTFYRSPEPGAPPFVSVGDTVDPGQTIGIVEAMKLMNRITADAAGTVTEVLAENAEPVEFGQPLIALSTAST